MIQLNLTSDGLAAKTRNNNLIFTKFVTGSGADDNGESIQFQEQLVDISYSQVYNAGSTYTVNGSSYVEQINHVKICGTLLFSEALEDYTLTEIALMAKEGENGTEFVFAYGANSQNSINVLSGDNTTYSLILDIIFDTTPNVTVITSGIGVTYSDLIAHINTNVSNGVHGLSYTNDDLKINGVSLDICKNDIFQKTTGITTYDTLPTPSLADEGKIVFNKQNSFSYKCVKSVEISIGDYIYEDNGSWSVGDGTENGALEVIADNSTPSSDEITLSNAQTHFMEWVITNNITKRLFSAEQQIDNKSDIGHSHLTADITDITATASELNTLDGITASTTELNFLSGVDSNIQTQLDDKSDVGHTHLTADITDITATASELNILDGVTVTSTDINSLSGVKSNIQQQINNMSVSAFIPLRQDNTTYAIGDVVKVTGLSIFEYLECIASGITGDGTSLTGSLSIGNAYVDGTCIWLCCDMRDGLQAGDMKYRFTDKDLAGYIKDNRTILFIDKDNPIESVANWRLLRLFRLILNPLLYSYNYNSLFALNISMPFHSHELDYLGAVILLNQWCNLTPLALTEIDYDITLQDYIDIDTFKNNNPMLALGYTETDFKDVAKSLLERLSTNVSIEVRVSNITDYYIKLQNLQKWVSRLENEGLPNITGTLGSLVSGNNNNTNPSSGALSWGGRGTATRYQNASTATANNWYDPAFDASRSNSIYGKSSHVTPASLHLCPFIKY